MPQDAKKDGDKPQTFQQTAPKDQAPLTEREADARALAGKEPAGNEPGAPPAESDPGIGANDAVTAQPDVSRDEEASEDNVQGRAVQVRTPEGDEIVVDSEEEARGKGEILGAASGLPFVASRPAYLDDPTHPDYPGEKKG